MKDILRLGLILLGFGIMSALLLGLTYQVTLEPITQSRALADQQNQQLVSPEADAFVPVEESVLAGIRETNPGILEIAEAQTSGQTIGYVAKSAINGFGGQMEVMVGVDRSGKVTGIRLGNHAETPGLGDNASKPEFYEQFPGLDIISGIGVNKNEPGPNEIQAITGATVTSRAVTDAVNALKAVVEEVAR
ncbi:MAG TPA: RnfABCDGE type electron transport complex subunit G [Tissierellia bacterium]|nr:RnfABCDGE type electron transport complex subunit G [Tissierellia bacterium]